MYLMYLRGFVVALRCNPVYHDLEQMKNIVWMRTDQTGREWKRRTGTGKVTVYPVFSGIELYYNDMHMAYCNKEQKTVYGTALFSY